MALPKGFNPNKMSFGSVTPVIEIPKNYSTSTSYSSRGSRRESLWSRFNNAIANLGNWFAGQVDNVISICCVLVILGIIITGLVYVIGAWTNQGFWWALLVAVGALIGGFICLGISWYVINIVVNVVMYGFRFLFWNGWTLLISLIIAVVGWLWVANFTSHSPRANTPIETVAPATQTYQCAAQVLNVRKSPNTYSNVIGILKKGQQVEVYETTNGFVRISYNGQNGYVSLKYLNRIN